MVMNMLVRAARTPPRTLSASPVTHPSDPPLSDSWAELLRTQHCKVLMLILLLRLWMRRRRTWIGVCLCVFDRRRIAHPTAKVCPQAGTTSAHTTHAPAKTKKKKRKRRWGRRGKRKASSWVGSDHHRRLSPCAGQHET